MSIPLGAFIGHLALCIIFCLPAWLLAIIRKQPPEPVEDIDTAYDYDAPVVMPPPPPEDPIILSETLRPSLTSETAPTLTPVGYQKEDLHEDMETVANRNRLKVVTSKTEFPELKILN